MDERLIADLVTLEFRLSPDDVEGLRAERDRLVRLLRGVLTRASEPAAPLLVVVGGGSGAGKSTVVNTLANRPVTTTGVIRPTTRVPTLVCHPDDRSWFTDDRVLPDLVRVSDDVADAAGGRQLRLAVSTALPAGVALLDAPDVDSVELANHALAEETLDAADAWVWLVTARTYADEVGMRLLRRARDRQALTAVAVTQTREGERTEVAADLDRLLASEGVRPALRTEVPYREVRNEQLPRTALADLRRWLEELAPADRRVEVRRSAVAGLHAALPGELADLLDSAEREQRVAKRLRTAVTGPFSAVSEDLELELETGLPLRAEVLERWRRLVGSNETLMKVQTAAGRLGELMRSRLGQPAGDGAQQVQVEVAGEVTGIVTRLLEGASRAARRELEGEPSGRRLLELHPELRDEPDDRPAQVRRVVAEWEDRIAELVEEVGGPRKARARRLSTALNSVATSAILVLFALSGGLTGGEVGIAAGAAAGSQWLLIKLFGEHNVRQLLAETRADLLARVEELTDVEQRRFVDAIAASEPPSAPVQTLHAAVRRGA